MDPRVHWTAQGAASQSGKRQQSGGVADPGVWWKAWRP